MAKAVRCHGLPYETATRAARPTAERTAPPRWDRPLNGSRNRNRRINHYLLRMGWGTAALRRSGEASLALSGDLRRRNRLAGFLPPFVSSGAPALQRQPSRSTAGA